MSYKVNDITFIKGQGGSGVQAEGNDFISGLLFYNDTRPALFTDNFAAGGVHQIFSPADAVAIGIDDTYSDEVLATATYTVTAIGANGDTLNISIAEWDGDVDLGTYTKVAGDTTVTLVATGVKNAINAGTNTHGYSATSAIGVVTITARQKTGLYLNAATAITATIVGTITGSVTADFSGGDFSRLAVYYYHIKRFFKKQPNGSLFVGIFDVPGTYDYEELRTMETHAEGAIVQCGIWSEETLATADLTAIQTVCDDMESDYLMLSSVVYCADVVSVATGITALAGVAWNLATLTAHKVTASIGQDMAGEGWSLFNQSGLTVGTVGADVGCIAEAAISEDIGNPISRFNYDDGIEFNTVGFGDGTTWTDATLVSRAKVDALNNNRFLFLTKILGFAGSYASDDHTSIAYTSDYAWINKNRIIDRVIKDVRIAFTPVLKSRLKLQTNGKLKKTTIIFLQELGGNVIRPLVASDDLAGDVNNFDASQWIIIDSNQLPNTSNKLVVAVKLAANAIAHKIEIPIGFSATL